MVINWDLTSLLQACHGIYPTGAIPAGTTSPWCQLLRSCVLERDSENRTV